jgi:hypothetical protein
MKKTKLAFLIFFFILPALFSEGSPILVFDGVNGYPSTGDSAYRIEISIAGNGLISEINAYSGGQYKETESTKIGFEKDKISGARESKTSRTKFDFSIIKNKIFRHIVVYDTVKNAVYSDRSSIVVIAPRPGVLFETDSRRFTQTGQGDFNIFDLETNEHLYTFAKNTIANDGWYRSDWKTRGNVTTIHEYQTMEKNAEWIDAGHGVFIGHAFNRQDPLINVVNFCILDVVYMNNPVFIPFIFGLKTGSY